MRYIKTILFISISIAFNSPLTAQDFMPNWSSHLGGHDPDYALASCVDQQNNVYTLGVFSDTAIYASQQSVTSNGRTDFFISKYDQSGDLVWLKTFGGIDYDGADNVFFSLITFPCEIKIDQQGQIYIMGNQKGLCDFDPGPDEYFLNSTELTNGFILKLNENGEFIFAQSYPNVFFKSMTISDNSIFLSGSFGNSVDFDLGIGETILNNSGNDAFILKLTNAGNYIKVLQFSSDGGAIVLDMAYDINSSNLYISGAFIGQFAFDSTLINNGINELFISDSQKGFICSINENLNLLNWMKIIESTNTGTVGNIEVLDSNTLIVSGDFKDTLSLIMNDQINTYYSNGPNKSFIALVNAQNGEFEKAICFGNSEPIYIQRVIKDQSNRILFASHVMEDSLNIELNNNSLIIQSTGIRHAFVVIIDTSFNYIAHFSACAGEYIFDIYDLSIGVNNEINIAGANSAPAYLCNQPNEIFMPFEGSFDAIGIQLTYDFTTDEGKLMSNKTHVVSPNPVDDFLHLNITEQLVSVKIIDLCGRRMYYSQSGLNDITLDKFLTPGIYSIIIETANSTYRERFFKK